jgi:hypothetical protein
VGFGKPEDGMSLRQYAAIKLRVPESGTDWLDDMIRKSLRTDLAAKAMQALITEPPWLEGGPALANILGQPVEDFDIPGRYAYVAYVLADSMLAARERS